MIPFFSNGRQKHARQAEFSSKITSLSLGGPANYISKLKPAPSRLSKLTNQAALFDSQRFKSTPSLLKVRTSPSSLNPIPLQETGRSMPTVIISISVSTGDRIGQVRESTTSTSSAKCFSANEPS